MTSCLLATPKDVDGSAVHVKFGLAGQLVMPCPGKGVLSRLEAIGDFVGEGRGVGAVRVLAQVVLPGEWASTFDRMNDLPLGVLGWRLVFGERYLARSPAVRSSADERELLRLSDLHLVESKSSFVFIDARTLLAREIRPIGLQIAVVKGRFAEGHWGAHLHMGVGGSDETNGRSHQNSSCRRHVGDAVVFACVPDEAITLRLEAR